MLCLSDPIEVKRKYLQHYDRNPLVRNRDGRTDTTVPLIVDLSFMKSQVSAPVECRWKAKFLLVRLLGGQVLDLSVSAKPAFPFGGLLPLLLATHIC